MAILTEMSEAAGTSEPRVEHWHDPFDTGRAANAPDVPTRCFYHWNAPLASIPAATHYQDLAGMPGSHPGVRLGLCEACKAVVSEHQDVYQIYSVPEEAA